MTRRQAQTCVVHEERAKVAITEPKLGTLTVTVVEKENQNEVHLLGNDVYYAAVWSRFGCYASLE